MKILIFLFYFVNCNDFWQSIKEYITIAAAVNGMFFQYLRFLSSQS